MGKSKSIEEMQKQDEKFNKYIDTIKERFERDNEKEKGKMDASIEDYYTKNKFTRKQLLANSNHDFRHEDKWSLDNLTGIINSMSKSLLESKEVKDVAKDANIAMEDFKNLELYTVGKVLQVLSEVLSSFGSKTSVTSKIDRRHTPIGYGLHLFITVSADSFSSNGFFKSENITQTLFMYEVNFSTEEALLMLKIGAIKTYTNEMAAYQKKIDSLLTKLNNNAIDPASFDKEYKIWDKMIARVGKKILELEARNRENAKQVALQTIQ